MKVRGNMQELPISYRVVNGLNMMAALATHPDAKDTFVDILASIHRRTNRSHVDLLKDFDEACEFIKKANDSAIAEVKTTDTKLTYTQYNPHKEENNE